MGKPESGGGASTYIYAIIFLLYAGIAVVLFIYMMNKRYFMCFNHIKSKLANGGELEKKEIWQLSKTNQSLKNAVTTGNLTANKKSSSSRPKEMTIYVLDAVICKSLVLFFVSCFSLREGLP